MNNIKGIVEGLDNEEATKCLDNQQIFRAD
jgi:hypothetical protein